MKIIQSILTNNDCFKAGRKIKVQGLMIHSVGVQQPDPMVFIRNWNRPGVQKCVHAFLDNKGNVYQTLPWDHRAWHAGASANNTHIGIEMTEPNTIRYLGGGRFEDLNPVATGKFVRETYEVAVELYAHLCKEFKLDPMKDIISHREGYLKGIASNHGDPEHIWRFFGLSMNGFRAAVKAKMEGPKPQPVNQKVVITANVLNVRESASTNSRVLTTVKKGEVYTISEKITNWGRVSGLGWISLDWTEPYVEPVKPKGETVTITATVLNVRQEPNTSSRTVGTVRRNEKHLVLEQRNGWGRLANGWISLYYTSKGNTEPVQVIEKRVIITASVLNVREQPNTTSKILRTVKNGEVYSISEERNGWGRIPNLGWISLHFTSAANDRVKITTPVLNVRERATAGSKMLRTVRQNEIHTVVERSNGWGRLSSGGWISLNYTAKA